MNNINKEGKINHVMIELPIINWEVITYYIMIDLIN